MQRITYLVGLIFLGFACILPQVVFAVEVYESQLSAKSVCVLLSPSEVDEARNSSGYAQNLGAEVATLVNGYRNAGPHEVNFDASGLASGVYIYRLTSGVNTASGKMVLMK